MTLKYYALPASYSSMMSLLQMTISSDGQRRSAARAGHLDFDHDFIAAQKGHGPRRIVLVEGGGTQGGDAVLRQGVQ